MLLHDLLILAQGVFGWRLEIAVFIFYFSGIPFFTNSVFIFFKGFLQLLQAAVLQLVIDAIGA